MDPATERFSSGMGSLIPCMEICVASVAKLPKRRTISVNWEMMFQDDARHDNDNGNTHGNANDGSRLVVIHTVSNDTLGPSRGES
jgi:hypothetical protein